MELLSPRTDHERHLTGLFRLSCQSLVAADDGSIECHTMRRGQMRIERHALNLPVSRNAWRLDPSIVRDNSRIVDRLTGKVLSESGGPIYGLAMDLGTTTVVIRLIDLETGELVADASLENPQRFGGSDVMNAQLPDGTFVKCKRRGLKIALSAGSKKGEGLMRRLAVGPDPVVMLDAALLEAARIAGIVLTVEDGAIFIEV